MATKATAKKSTAKKSTTNGKAKATENQQRYIGHALTWRSKDGTFEGGSPTGNWNGSQYALKRWLDTQGVPVDERRAELKKAYEALMAGKQSATVCNLVTVKVAK